MLSLGYLYFVIFFCLIRLDIKVSTPTRPINIRTMTISLLSLPKVGVRSRLEPTVLRTAANHHQHHHQQQRLHTESSHAHT